MMKKLTTHIVSGLMGVVLLSLLTLSSLRVAAQAPASTASFPAPTGNPADSVQYEVHDSLVYVLVSRVDTSLVGSNIFNILKDDSNGRRAQVHIHQSKEVEQVMLSCVKANKDRTFEGYRVRIFFKESARGESEEIQRSFAVRHPGVPAYLSYANPYFKVTVGDFRTKSEAMQLMTRIISEYPTAFVVKESIHYPVVNKENTYYIDTVKVYRPMVKK